MAIALTSDAVILRRVTNAFHWAFARRILSLGAYKLGICTINNEQNLDQDLKKAEVKRQRADASRFPTLPNPGGGFCSGSPDLKIRPLLSHQLNSKFRIKKSSEAVRPLKHSRLSKA
jgi:hypothetical protein